PPPGRGMERGFHQAGCGAGTAEVATESLCRSDSVQLFHESPAAPTSIGIAFPRRIWPYFPGDPWRGKKSQIFGFAHANSSPSAIYLWYIKIWRSYRAN